MKRSPIRRTVEQVRAWESRQREPIPRIGKRSIENRSAWAAVVALVRLRLWCEAASLTHDGKEVCGRRGPHEGSDTHHVWPEDRDSNRHDLDRLLWLCRNSHRWAHDHPAIASQLGLLRPSTNKGEN